MARINEDPNARIIRGEEKALFPGLYLAFHCLHVVTQSSSHSTYTHTRNACAHTHARTHTHTHTHAHTHTHTHTELRQEIEYLRALMGKGVDLTSGITEIRELREKLRESEKLMTEATRSVKEGEVEG